MLIVNASSRKIIDEMSFDEFGILEKDHEREDRDNVEIPFGFAGGLYDEHTGLVRFGARDYNPTVGRWTSKDPIGFGGGDTNLYGYVLQNPISNIDPSGKGPLSGLICLSALRTGTLKWAAAALIKKLADSIKQYKNSSSLNNSNESSNLNSDNQCSNEKNKKVDSTFDSSDILSTVGTAALQTAVMTAIDAYGPQFCMFLMANPELP